VLLEEGLEGQELSFIVVTDGQRHAPLVPTEITRGLLTAIWAEHGGHGRILHRRASAPGLREQILDSIVQPTMRGLAGEGFTTKGFCTLD